VSPARTHAALRWVPIHRVPGKVSPRLTPGTRKPRNGVKILNLNVQNLNLDFARSCEVCGCLEGVKGREDVVRHRPAGRGRCHPEGQPCLGDPSPSPADAPALPLRAQCGKKMSFLGTDARAWGEGRERKGLAATSWACRSLARSWQVLVQRLSCSVALHVPCQHCQTTARRARCGHSV